MQPHMIWTFWFQEADPKQWWKKDAEFDADIRRRFTAVHQAACAGELFSWRADARGRLAEILVLDQFSRNIFRAQPQAFASDPQALVLTQKAIERGVIELLPEAQAAFILMPIVHSESLVVHDAYASWFERAGFEGTRRSEQRHRHILERFGRYPHRNAVLGRRSTADETAFLLEPASSF